MKGNPKVNTTPELQPSTKTYNKIVKVQEYKLRPSSMIHKDSRSSHLYELPRDSSPYWFRLGYNCLGKYCREGTSRKERKEWGEHIWVDREKWIGKKKIPASFSKSEGHWQHRVCWTNGRADGLRLVASHHWCAAHSDNGGHQPWLNYPDNDRPRTPPHCALPNSEHLFWWVRFLTLIIESLFIILDLLLVSSINIVYRK